MNKVIQTIRFSLVVFFICIFPLFSHSQKGKVKLLNSRAIDHSQYKEVKGSPYFYQEWKFGKMINSRSLIIDSLLVNYNGFTDNFEVRQDDEYVELETKFYPLVIVYDGDKEVYFRRNNHKQIESAYARIVYTGVQASVLQNYVVTTRKSSAAYAGITDEGTFIGKKKFFLLLNEEIHLIKLNRKSILSRLGFTSELKSFLKEKKLNLKSEGDLVILLEYYDTLF